MFPVNCNGWYPTTWTLICSNWISPFTRQESVPLWTLPHSCGLTPLCSSSTKPSPRGQVWGGSSLTWNQTEWAGRGRGGGHCCVCVLCDHLLIWTSSSLHTDLTAEAVIVRKSLELMRPLQPSRLCGRVLSYCDRLNKIQDIKCDHKWNVACRSLRVCKSLIHTRAHTRAHPLAVWSSPHLEQIKGLSCLQGSPAVSECWCWVETTDRGFQT